MYHELISLVKKCLWLPICPYFGNFSVSNFFSTSPLDYAFSSHWELTVSEFILTPQKKQINLYFINFWFITSTSVLNYFITLLAFSYTSLLTEFFSLVRSVVNFQRISFLNKLIYLPAKAFFTWSRFDSTSRGSYCRFRLGAIWFWKEVRDQVG